ncbi:hypothetical protein M5K25_005900 [Dendrobium thyrsiflorum]|uniref:Uncharacterized protein n=1 Tax=Dendrobium thyrsiflorum TaxID=117978 RepID=A0ABD0VA23_DENTH
MAAKKIDALEERLEGEMSQIKVTVEDRISSMEGKFLDLQEMVKRIWDLQNQTAASEARVPAGRNTNYDNRRDENDMEILEGERRRPPMEPFQREERGGRYGERREYVEYEQRGVVGERREGDYGWRASDFKGRKGEIEEAFGNQWMSLIEGKKHSVMGGMKMFGGFTGFGRRSPRKGESYLHSDRAPVLTSDQNVVTSDPTGKWNVVEVAKSNNHEGTEEATREILHLLRSKEAKQQRRKKADEKQT